MIKKTEYIESKCNEFWKRSEADRIENATRTGKKLEGREDERRTAAKRTP
jgi:hypothetical protein